jgi:hypothetical protein
MRAISTAIKAESVIDTSQGPFCGRRPSHSFKRV